MANSTGLTTASLLETAGVAKPSFEDMVSLAATNQERMVPLLTLLGDASVGFHSNTHYQAIVNTRTMSTLYSMLDTGAGPTESTAAKGAGPTPEAEDGSKVQFQRRWTANRAQMSKDDWAAMTQPERMEYIRDLAIQQGAALGEQRDTDLCALAAPALITSGNEFNSAAPADITEDLLDQCIQQMIYLKQRPPYVLMAPYNQFSVLRKLKFNEYQISGIPGILSQDLSFRYGPLTIICHNNAYSDGVDGYWGLMFGPGAIKFKANPADAESWYEKKDLSYYVDIDQRYAWHLVHQRVLAIQMPL